MTDSCAQHLEALQAELAIIRALLSEVLNNRNPKPPSAEVVAAFQAQKRLDELLIAESKRLAKDATPVVRCHHAFRDRVIRALVEDRRFVNTITLDDGRKGVTYKGATLVVDWALNDAAIDNLYIERDYTGA